MHLRMVTFGKRTPRHDAVHPIPTNTKPTLLAASLTNVQAQMFKSLAHPEYAIPRLVPSSAVIHTS